MNNRFGTTSDMIIQTVQEKEGCACLAIDEKGLYLTSPEYVDRPLADPNRYAGNRKDVAARLDALSLDAASLFEQNQHRIPKITGEAKKKVNPLKASKRSMKGCCPKCIGTHNRRKGNLPLFYLALS